MDAGLLSTLTNAMSANQVIDLSRSGQFEAGGTSPIISSVKGSEVWHQTIEDDFLLIVDWCEPGERRYFLFAPSSALCVLLPQPDQPIANPHKHDYLELVAILDGELDFTVEGRRRCYRAGDCSILNQNAWHAEGMSTSYLAAYFSIRPSLLKELISRDSRCDALAAFLSRNVRATGEVDYVDIAPRDREDRVRELSLLTNHVIQELIERLPGYRSVVQGYLERLLGTLGDPRGSTLDETRFSSASSDDLMEHIVSYVLAQRRRVTRNELSRVFSYNGNYLSDVFRTRTGTSLAVWCRDACMREAARMLRDTDLPISEIARALGYRGRSNFYAHFRDSHGMTPAAYRTMIRRDCPFSIT